VLCAWLVFAERLIYPSYAAVPRLWGISALDDQAAAGALMWVPGSVAFLLPVAWSVGQMLSPHKASRRALRPPRRGLGQREMPLLPTAPGRHEVDSHTGARQQKSKQQTGEKHTCA
jgi:hypothetical protein